MRLAGAITDRMRLRSSLSPARRAVSDYAGAVTGDVMTALLLTLSTENAELREQLASAQEMLVETAIDAGNMHVLVEAMRTERDAWREEAERLQAQAVRRA